MLLPIPDVLTADQILKARQILDQAEWVDGRVTAGHQSARAKDNMQLPEGLAGRARLGGDDFVCAGRECALHFGGAAGAGVSAAVQPLSGRAIVRDACGQRDPSR